MDSEAERRRGLGYGVTAYLMWGLFPLYWPLLEPAGAIEILAHRMLWSLGFVAILLWRAHSWAAVRAIVADREKRILLALAAVVISFNWGTYIWGVNSKHVVETSLGYFINPLFTIVLGVVLLHERLRRTQWVAVGIASGAIVILTVNYGRLPWIALVLATSFGLYGYFKKRASVGAVESLAVETGFLAIPALATLVFIQLQGNLAFAHHSAGNSVLLVLTGAVTAIPLLFFGAAARRLPLSVIGLVQYLAPLLQFRRRRRHRSREDAACAMDRVRPGLDRARRVDRRRRANATALGCSGPGGRGGCDRLARQSQIDVNCATNR